MELNKDFEKMRVPYGMAVHDVEEENAVLDVIRNHKTILGEKVKKFESEVAKLFGKELGIMVWKSNKVNYISNKKKNVMFG